MIIGKNVETLLSALRDAFNRLVNGKQVVGSQTIDVRDNAVSTLTVPAGATEAVMVLERATASAADPYTQAVRWSVTDVVPVTGTYAGLIIGPPDTTKHGMPWNVLVPMTIKGSDALRAFKVVAVAVTGAGTLALKVTYYK
jgi:hypothetical protein